MNGKDVGMSFTDGKKQKTNVQVLILAQRTAVRKVSHTSSCSSNKTDLRLTFAILTAVSVKDIAFSDLTPCNLIDGYKSFGGTCWCHFQSEMEDITTYKTFVLGY